jgi:hypothetical protein
MINDCSKKVKKYPNGILGTFDLKAKNFSKQGLNQKIGAEKDILRSVIGDQKNYRIIIEKNNRLEIAITLPRNVVQQSI